MPFGNREEPRHRQGQRIGERSLPQQGCQDRVGGSLGTLEECASESPTEHMQMRPVCMQMGPSICR